MTYKLRDIPYSTSKQSEIADFMEYECLKSEDKTYSALAAAQAMGIINEEGVDDDIEEDVKYRCCREALGEMEDRTILCNHKYPFSISSEGLEIDSQSDDELVSIYTFLLLATRENMGTGSRLSDGTDGTQLFEQLCSLVAKNYFGDKANSFVFGTGGAISSFPQKVDDMLKKLAEKGYRFRPAQDHPSVDRDGKVDIVAFIPFLSDKRKGQFLAFGQCKTGTNWIPLLGQTDGDVFSRSYIEPPFRFTPIVFFMVAESVGYNDFESLCMRSKGLLFDRNRLMNFMPKDIPPGLLMNIRRWNQFIFDKDR